MASTSTPHSALLFALRSTTPLPAKLALAEAAHEATPSPVLSQVIRDWILESFLRSKATKESTVLSDSTWWNLLSLVVPDALGSSATPTLPIFVAFFTLYPTLDVSRGLLQKVANCWRKLGGGAMRKATVDAALEGYAVVLKASVLVLEREGAEGKEEWSEIIENWLKLFRNVMDAGKGGKKIPSHTLSNLSSILPLLSLLSSKSSLHRSILSTLSICLFNLDNLRRGIARETYNVGVTNEKEAVSSDSAEGELLNALRSALTETLAMKLHVLNALPHLFSLYRTALDAHSATLFPLPARSSFPTASAARSATEIHSLQKRRSLAGNWIRGVTTFIEWHSSSKKGGAGEQEADCLWKTFEEVEKGDLYRAGNGEGWEGILESIVEASVTRLAAIKQETELRTREAVMGLLATIMRLSFESVEASLPAILITLASTSSTLAPATSTTSDFLTALLIHHSRSLLLPSLLSILSDALASPSAITNNLLTTFEWNSELSKALEGLVGITVKGCWEDLVSKMTPDDSEMELDNGGSKLDQKSLAARTRIITLLIRSLPSPIPLSLFSSFAEDFVAPAASSLVNGDDSGVAVEMLAARYAIIERIRLEGLAQDEPVWTLSEDMVESLRRSVETREDGAVVVEISRTLLQSIKLSTPPATAQAILSAILSRISAGESSWTGELRGIGNDAIRVALWELMTRRWLSVFEHFASDAQALPFAAIVVANMNGSESTAAISFSSVTARLLRRADFYEMRSIQKHFQSALLDSVSAEVALSPSLSLSAIAAKKFPKAFRLLTSTVILRHISTFRGITSLIPVEFIGKLLRNALIDRAIGLDIWISSKGVEVLEAESLVDAQTVLRRFVVMVKGDGLAISDGPAIFALLARYTVSDFQSLTDVTVQLYKKLLESALLVIKSNPLDVAPLISFVDAFEKPLSDLAKRSKKNLVAPNCEELAFFTLCETLASHLGDSKSIDAALLGSIQKVSKSSKYLVKALLATVVALEGKGEVSVFDAADMIDACRSMWRLKDWLSEGTIDDGQVAIFATFCQTTLAQLISVTTHQVHATKALRACLSMLDLLSVRLARLRTISDPAKLSTLPFETFLACHLTFRQSLRSIPGAPLALEENLRKAVGISSIAEYTTALDAISESIGASVAADDSSLESSLEIALILIRDGPEGSSRLSSSCVSEILRHLAFFLVRHTSTSALTTSTLESGKSLAEKYLVFARFLDGICGDRPMLLSRQNVSSILALVAQIMLPSGIDSTDSAVPSPTALSSELYLTLVSITSHLVRHRKDHITPLFPSLVSILASFLSALRRAGFGTTGSSSAINFDDDTAGVGLGKRAEREAKATFPFWVWEGGAKGVGKVEAKTVGRLLASLSAKTATNLKRKRDAPTTTIQTEVTTSLIAPLSKHAPFIFLPYLRSCVHAVSPIPSTLRAELQGGWFEMMDVMGKWEREALMKGFLKDEEEAERGVLRQLWRAHEKERYRG